MYKKSVQVRCINKYSLNNHDDTLCCVSYAYCSVVVVDIRVEVPTRFLQHTHR